RHHGMVRDPAHMERHDGPWYYELPQPGINGRLSDIHAALGCSQLGKLERFIERRRQIAATYRKAFGTLPGVTMQHELEDRDHAYHLFVVHLDPARYDRRGVFEAMRERG